MPTLTEKGSIIKQKWMSNTVQNRIDSMRSIDFVIEYIADRCWTGSTPPKEHLTGPGGKVIVLRSGTGSGKSTLLPPFLFKKFFETTKKNIICTQPTKITTTDIPYQILQYNKFLTMGETIGYQTGSIAWKPTKGILFSTYGILLQHLRIMEDDQFMKRYGFIIIDEIHKRTVDIDNSLFYLKKLLERNWDKPECPIVILTSATFEPEIFMDYFGCPENNFLDVAGASFPIEDNFAPYDISNYIDYVVDLVEKIHVDKIEDIVGVGGVGGVGDVAKPGDPPGTKVGNTFRDIMIFTQGGAQIKQITDRIHKLNADVFAKGFAEAKKHAESQWSKYKTGGADVLKKQQFYIAPIMMMSANIEKGEKDYRDLFSDISVVKTNIYEFDEEGNRTDVVLRTVPASRRVVISTNAAETGLTIDSLGYCIDTGWVKQSSFDPNYGCDILVDKNITQSSSRQRRGRVGRKAKGAFYACYTKAVYDKMAALQFPELVNEDVTLFIMDVIINETEAEIVRYADNDIAPQAFKISQLTDEYWEIKTKKLFDASLLDLIQYPSADSLSYSVEKLYGLGFIDHEYKPTIMGFYAPKFRKISIENIRMIMAGYGHRANILDLITIACCIEVGFKIGINKRKYKPRNPLNVDEITSAYNFRILFADEFIEYLFIWTEFMDTIDMVGEVLRKVSTSKDAVKTNKISTKYVHEWLDKNGFNFDGLKVVIELRDQVIGDMLTAGLNPFYNGLNLPRGGYNLVEILQRNLTEGMEEICKIKRCIYDGYRFNLCIWNESLSSYVNQTTHNRVSVDSKIVKPMIADEDIKQIRPQKIIISSMTVNPSMDDEGMYEFVAGDISVMDGFVDVDENFLMY